LHPRHHRQPIINPIHNATVIMPRSKLLKVDFWSWHYMVFNSVSGFGYDVITQL